MTRHILLYRDIAPDLEARLAEQARVTRLDLPALATLPTTDRDDLLRRIDGMIGVGEPVGPELLDVMPALRAISTISVGFDGFDVADLTRRGILLTNTPDVLTETTADMLFALILSVGRRLLEVSDLVRQGRWTGSLPASYFGTDIHHKTLGIIGMGRIGQSLARRAHAGFAMSVLYHSRTVKAEVERRYQARYCEVPELLAQSDYVCVILPLTEETRGMISGPEFALMKPSAFIINGGRGPVIDEDALVLALAEGRIAGAGLDVYAREPLDPESPLLRFDNVVALPHIGSATNETRRAMAEMAVDNLLAALDRAVGARYVNPELLRRT